MTRKIRVKKVVLDILKPHEPPLIELAKRLNELSYVKRVDITVLEIDRKTETLKGTIEGTDINLEDLRKHIEEMGATIHSVDEVVTKKD